MAQILISFARLAKNCHSRRQGIMGNNSGSEHAWIQEPYQRYHHISPSDHSHGSARIPGIILITREYTPEINLETRL